MTQFATLTPTSCSRRQIKGKVVVVVVLALFPSNPFESSNMAATGKLLVVVALFMLPIVAHGLFSCYFLFWSMLFGCTYYFQRLCLSRSGDGIVFWGDEICCPSASACVALRTTFDMWHSVHRIIQIQHRVEFVGFLFLVHSHKLMFTFCVLITIDEFIIIGNCPSHDQTDHDFKFRFNHELRSMGLIPDVSLLLCYC